MSQLNVQPRTPSDPDEGSRSAVANNLTWAIGVVLIIAALAVAIVYVAHNIHI